MGNCSKCDGSGYFYTPTDHGEEYKYKHRCNECNPVMTDPDRIAAIMRQQARYRLFLDEVGCPRDDDPEWQAIDYLLEQVRQLQVELYGEQQTSRGCISSLTYERDQQAAEIERLRGQTDESLLNMVAQLDDEVQRLQRENLAKQARLDALEATRQEKVWKPPTRKQIQNRMRVERELGD